jgi:hypothetical protein
MVKIMAFLALTAFAGCNGGSGGGYRDASSYCASQDSEMAVWQCQQYYAHNRFEASPETAQDVGGGGGPGQAYWLGMMAHGFEMMAPPPAARPVITNCSTFGQRGMGMSCTSY